MPTPDDAASFAAFRETVFDDHALLRQLRPPLEEDGYVAQIVSVGASRGHRFGEAQVRAALREGEMTWLMQGIDVA